MNSPITVPNKYAMPISNFEGFLKPSSYLKKSIKNRRKDLECVKEEDEDK